MSTRELIAAQEVQLGLRNPKVVIEPRHVYLLEPMVKILVDSLSPTQPILFRRHGEDFRVCDSTFRVAGAEMAFKILLAAPGDISAIAVEMPATEVPDGPTQRESAEDDYEGTSPDNDDDGLSVSSISMVDITQDREDVELYRQFIDDDSASPEFREYARKLVNDSKGFAKPVHESHADNRDDEKNSPEAARKRVRKSVGYFVDRLCETPDTRHVGLHFRQHLKTGQHCQYTGNWRFEFS